MAYQSGGTIQALDYNLLTWGGNTSGVYNLGSGTGSLAINTIARAYGRGLGNVGYGQDLSPINAISTTPLTTTITAAQWTGLIGVLNRALAHQGGAAAQLASGSNIGVTAGATIQYFANVQNAVDNINNLANVRQYGAGQGTTTTGVVFWSNITVGTNAFSSNSITRTITFASGDAARYFFNAGGQINWTFAGTTNIGASTSRTSDMINLFRTTIVGGNIRAYQGQSIQGTGNTAIVNATTIGYYTANTTPYQLANVQSTATSYTTDYANVRIQMSAANVGGFSDNGSTITLMYGLFSAPRALNFNANLSIALSCRIDIVNPETTYLTSTWGTPTIA
jgi:hypothetical protein